MSFNASSVGTPSPYDFNYKLLGGISKFPSLLAGIRAGAGYTDVHTYTNTNKYKYYRGRTF